MNAAFEKCWPGVCTRRAGSRAGRVPGHRRPVSGALDGVQSALANALVRQIPSGTCGPQGLLSGGPGPWKSAADTVAGSRLGWGAGGEVWPFGLPRRPRVLGAGRALNMPCGEVCQIRSPGEQIRLLFFVLSRAAAASLCPCVSRQRMTYGAEEQREEGDDRGSEETWRRGDVVTLGVDCPPRPGPSMAPARQLPAGAAGGAPDPAYVLGPAGKEFFNGRGRSRML